MPTTTLATTTAIYALATKLSIFESIKKGNVQEVPLSRPEGRGLSVSQEKKTADYTSGTYFIHPKLIEEMRQLQRQKRQHAKEQKKESSEQASDLASQKKEQDTLDADKQPGEQAKQSAPTDHVNTVPVQPTPKE